MQWPIPIPWENGAQAATHVSSMNGNDFLIMKSLVLSKKVRLVLQELIYRLREISSLKTDIKLNGTVVDATFIL